MVRSIETLPIRPVTKHLIHNLFLDKPLGIPAVADFGVESVDHYRALKTIVFYGDEQVEEEEGREILEKMYERIIELDRAFGNGPALNALVRKYAPAYAKIVHFHTSWDEIFGRSDEEQGEA